jgi:ATP-dependent phosphoenolpyruvate carboxykinase
MKPIDLSSNGITVPDILRNAAPATLYQEAIRRERNSAISDTGALIAYSGQKTGRSPQDSLWIGSRIKLKFTRAIIDAIHSGDLAGAPTQRDAIFGLNVVTAVPGVPEEILIPERAWADHAAFHATASKLARLFIENFQKSERGAAPAVKAAGPTIQSTTGQSLMAAG